MQANNTIRVYNNGLGIPVDIHKEEGVYVPELIFGHLLTSSNYNDKDAKVGRARAGGRAGFGAGWHTAAAAAAAVAAAAAAAAGAENPSHASTHRHADGPAPRSPAGATATAPSWPTSSAPTFAWRPPTGRA
jgi:hypothetical protein